MDNALRPCFLRGLLAACTSCGPAAALGQSLPRSSSWRVRLSHLYTREGKHLRRFQAAEDGDGVIPSLDEGGNAATEAVIDFHPPGRRVEAAFACAAREQNGLSRKAHAGSIRVPLKPFETGTVRVRLA